VQLRPGPLKPDVDRAQHIIDAQPGHIYATRSSGPSVVFADTLPSSESIETEPSVIHCVEMTESPVADALLASYFGGSAPKRQLGLKAGVRALKKYKLSPRRPSFGNDRYDHDEDDRDDVDLGAMEISHVQGSLSDAERVKIREGAADAVRTASLLRGRMRALERTIEDLLPAAHVFTAFDEAMRTAAETGGVDGPNEMNFALGIFAKELARPDGVSPFKFVAN
jgi:hypothetical protein